MNTYFNLSAFFNAFPILLARLPYTLGIVLASVLIGMFIGTLLTCLGRIHNRMAKTLITYYGLPMLLSASGVDINSSDPLIFALIAFSLSLSAFFEETLRAGFDAIDNGQLQAAQSLSLPKLTYYRRIIIPQALINSLPNFASLLITAIKQSSILFTIGIMDIYEKAITLSAEDFGLWQLEIFLALMLIYWILAVIIDKATTLIYSVSLKKVA